MNTYFALAATQETNFFQDIWNYLYSVYLSVDGNYANLGFDKNTLFSLRLLVLGIFVGTVFVLSLIIKQDLTVALYEVLGGGLLIGAIFMATDYATTPNNKLGKMVFALGCGVITVLIRFWGDYPEGFSFAILIMNILSPYIERACAAKPFGKVGKRCEEK